MENKKEDEIHDLLKQTIARKDIERQIADLFYKLCPHVPPQLLATTVMQTLDNFKSLEYIYIYILVVIIKEIIEMMQQML